MLKQSFVIFCVFLLELSACTILSASCRCGGPDNFCESAQISYGGESSQTYIVDATVVSYDFPGEFVTLRINHYYYNGGNNSSTRRIYRSTGGSCAVQVSGLGNGSRYLMEIGFSERDGRNLNFILDCGVRILPIVDDIVVGKFAPGQEDMHIDEIGSSGCIAPWIQNVGLFTEIVSSQLSIKSPANLPIQVGIVDGFGRLNHLQQYTRLEASIPISLPHLPTGIYFIHVSDGIRSSSKRIFIN